MSDAGHSNASHEAKDWTKSQADQITELYKSLSGKYQEEANKLLFSDHQLPYEQAHHILTDLLKKQESQSHKNGGLERKVKNAPYLDLGIIALTAGLLAAAPPLGIVAGSLYLMSKYYSTQPKQEHH